MMVQKKLKKYSKSILWYVYHIDADTCRYLQLQFSFIKALSAFPFAIITGQKW